ncbi:hypothetical protein GAGA_0566 [Paraglaciecola agarilytica NO2]|uniref:Uncharacterized protein n=1 Tax=Paraglaciecola agarilytica NO2 TaxID=1125747 RepID=A0ABQ0I293_9ALTE|nr:hypothetical protein GAGA_0566 [Paraglaciecola agarilytica NO2]
MCFSSIVFDLAQPFDDEQTHEHPTAKTIHEIRILVPLIKSIKISLFTYEPGRN